MASTKRLAVSCPRPRLNDTPSDLRSRRISAQSSTISTCFLPDSTPATVTRELVNFQPQPRTGRFYVSSSGRGQRLKLAKQLSGDIALQAPLDVADGLALGEATLDVVLGGAVLTYSD